MNQHFLIRFVLSHPIQEMTSTHFSVAYFHFSGVQDLINLLVVKSQRDLKARENAFKNNLLAA